MGAAHGAAPADAKRLNPPREALPKGTITQMAPAFKPANGVNKPKTIPVGVREKLRPVVSLTLSAPDLRPVLAEDARAATNPGKTSQRIGIRRALEGDQAVAPADDWVVSKEGSAVWSAELTSDGALAMRVHFAEMSVPPGTTFVVYNADRPEEVVGPYDRNYAGGRTEFWSETIFGSRVVVECRVPAGQATDQTRFVVSEVVHRYRLPEDPKANRAKEGTCHNDISCAASWVDTSYAVAGLGSITTAGEIWCTGCLLADADETTYVDYFMTANHCVKNQDEANSLEFYWFYQTATCNGTVPAILTVPRTGGGADFLAGATRSTGNDFAFLLLRQESPGGVAYAGWNADLPSTGGDIVGIHHPDGSHKRISYGTLSNADSDFLFVQWSSGVTEAGSSGSPLFNISGQFLGQLYGGDSSCATPTGLDEYGRFDVSFPIIQNWLLSLPATVKNDAFSNARTITGAQGGVYGSTAGATKEVGEPTHGGTPISKSVWFRWTAPQSGMVAFDTLGGYFDTTLGVYRGTAVSGLTLVATNDDFYGTLSRVSFTAVANTTYFVAVDGYNGAAGVVRLNWSMTAGTWNDNFASAQIISGSRGDVAGNSMGATVEASEPYHADQGGSSIWYRWTAPANGSFTFDTEGSSFDTVLAVYRGTSVAGLTLVGSNDDINYDGGIYRSRVTFTAVAGTIYQVAVDGYYDSSTDYADAGTVLLTWYPTTASGVAPNDAFGTATTVSGATATGSNVGSSLQAGEPSPGGYSVGKLVWYSWTAPANGLATFDTIGSDFDTVVGVYSGTTLATLVELAYNDDISRDTRASRVGFTATVGTVYRIAVAGLATTSGVIRDGTVKLNWSLGAGMGLNDLFAQAAVLSAATGLQTNFNRGANHQAAEPYHAGNVGGASLWYLWVAPATGLATFETTVTNMDTLLAVYTGSSLGSLVTLASNDDTSAPGNLGSRVTFAAVSNQLYYVAVDGYNEAGTVSLGYFNLGWNLVATQPVRLASPRLATGGNLQFVVTGTAGQSIDIYGATQMSNWTLLTNVVIGTGGTTVNLDTKAVPTRIYQGRSH